MQSVNLEQDAKEIDEYLETLKKAGEDAQRQDIFSKANLYQESNFSIKNLSSLVEMIEAVETLLGSIEYKEFVEKYVGRRSLLRLAIALREQYIQEKTDSLHKEYVNSLITSVKKELSVRSSTTAVPDIDLYQILMNQHKVQVFRDVVRMIKKPRVIQAQNLYSYRVVAQSSPFSGALAMQKVSRSKTVFSDAFKEYNDPYKFLQVLKVKDIPASEYYKYFVNITYEVFNQYGSPASGGERSEYNLLQELSDGVKNNILILDEPESSFDNIFLREDTRARIEYFPCRKIIVCVIYFLYSRWICFIKRQSAVLLALILLIHKHQGNTIHSTYAAAQCSENQHFFFICY